VRACVYVTWQLLSREVSPLITSLPATPRALPRGVRAYHSFLRCNLQRPLNASMNEVGKLLEYRSAGCVYTRWIRKREPPSPPSLLPTSESRAAVDQNQFQIAAGDNVSRPRFVFRPFTDIAQLWNGQTLVLFYFNCGNKLDSGENYSRLRERYHRQRNRDAIVCKF